ALLLVVGLKAVLAPSVLADPIRVATVDAPRRGPAAPTPGSDPDLTRLVGSKRMTVCHLASCSNVRLIKDEHRIEFATADEAAAAGYHPGRCCQPTMVHAPSAAARVAPSD